MRISLPDLVALLYRADWTRLSLSATLTWSRDPAVEWELTQRKLAELRPLFGPLPRIGLLPDWEPDDAYGGPQHGEQQVLLAPGGRYRIEAGDGDLVSVGDGGQSWPAEALAALLDPAWLLSGWRLLSSRPVTVRGRAGFRLLAEVTGTGEDNTDNSFTAAEAVVDAELGILLRQTAYVGEHPAVRTELRELVVRDEDTAEDFRIEPTPGLRAVADSGGPLGDRNLPQVVDTAGTAAGLAVAGAIAGAISLTGWLDKHRARRDQP